jgi:acetylglutamate kinase
MDHQRLIGKAKVLVEALPYIKEFSGITAVIKYGGAALINDEIKSTIMEDVALMKYVGFRPVVVHGGGPDINRLLERLGLEKRFINGLRVTDGETAEAVEMALTAKINKMIVGELNRHGVCAVGISGKDGPTIIAKKRGGEPDLGFVGDVERVDTRLIKTLLDNDFIPVISPVGGDFAGGTYNINADHAAVAVAGALKADKLVFLTDVEGVRLNADDGGSVAPFLTVSDIRRLVENGVISGGMIPKAECCAAAVESGTRHVHILDGRIEHSLILEIFTKNGIGTMISKGEE